MTNRRRQPTEKTLRQPRGASIASAKGADVYELLLAELQARRVRLERLLRLVCLEAARRPATRALVPSCALCGHGRGKRVT